MTRPAINQECRSLSATLEGPEQTREFAARFAQSLPKNCVLALYGDLGAGKTTFMQGLVRGLKGNEDEVHSPTYLYLHLYDTDPPVFHFDLYRMQSPKDFTSMGFEEYFEKGGITAIEWPEKIENLLPASTISLYFTHQEPCRIVRYELI